MNEKLMVMTYDLDLPQLMMMCHCLDKNWKGQKKLTIVCGKSGRGLEKSYCIDQTHIILDQYMADDWIVDVVPSVESHMTSGVDELQLNKVLFSLDIDTTDTIVLDSKDFLLKPADLSDFIIDGNYRVQYFQTDQKFSSIYPTISKFIDVADDLPATLVLSPWVWKNSQVRNYWQLVQQIFGPYYTWKEFPFFCEWAGFYAFTVMNQTNMKFCDRKDGDWVPAIGIWTHQNYENALTQAENFDRWTVHKFWKHSRKVQDPRCLNITVDVLRRYNIDDSVIKCWRDQNQQISDFNLYSTENSDA